MHANTVWKPLAFRASFAKDARGLPPVYQHQWYGGRRQTCCCDWTGLPLLTASGSFWAHNTCIPSMRWGCCNMEDNKGKFNAIPCNTPWTTIEISRLLKHINDQTIISRQCNMGRSSITSCFTITKKGKDRGTIKINVIASKWKMLVLHRSLTFHVSVS